MRPLFKEYTFLDNDLNECNTIKSKIKFLFSYCFLWLFTVNYSFSYFTNWHREGVTIMISVLMQNITCQTHPVWPAICIFLKMLPGSQQEDNLQLNRHFICFLCIKMRMHCSESSLSSLITCNHVQFETLGGVSNHPVVLLKGGDSSFNSSSTRSASFVSAALICLARMGQLHNSSRYLLLNPEVGSN